MPFSQCKCALKKEIIWTHTHTETMLCGDEGRYQSGTPSSQKKKNCQPGA